MQPPDAVAVQPEQDIPHNQRTDQSLDPSHVRRKPAKVEFLHAAQTKLLQTIRLAARQADVVDDKLETRIPFSGGRKIEYFNLIFLANYDDYH